MASMPRASTFSYPARAHRSTKPKLKYSRKPGRSEEVPDLEPRADALRKQPSFLVAAPARVGLSGVWCVY